VAGVVAVVEVDPEVVATGASVVVVVAVEEVVVSSALYNSLNWNLSNCGKKLNRIGVAILVVSTKLLNCSTWLCIDGIKHYLSFKHCSIGPIGLFLMSLAVLVISFILQYMITITLFNLQYKVNETGYYQLKSLSVDPH